MNRYPPPDKYPATTHTREKVASINDLAVSGPLAFPRSIAAPPAFPARHSSSASLQEVTAWVRDAFVEMGYVRIGVLAG